MEPEVKSKESPWAKAEFTVNRRNFLIGTVVGGFTTAAAGLLAVPSIQDELFKKLDRKSITERLTSELVSNRRNGIITAVESIVMFAGSVTVGAVADRVGLPHGNHASLGEVYEEDISERPIRTYVRDNVAIPIMEEALFRMLPSSLFTEEKPPNVKLHWKTGIASTLLFGAIHNISRPEHDKLTIHLNSLPLEQLILGTYCWYAQRKGGFVHAAGAHIFYNNLCNIYAHYFDREPVNQAKSKNSS